MGCAVGVKFEFKCTKCGVQVLDTRHERMPDHLHLALSPWLSLCTQHEKEYFDSKKLTGHQHIQIIENPVEVEGTVIITEQSDEPTQFHVEVK